MAEQRTAARTRSLTPQRWRELVAAVHQPMPFSRPEWLTLGLRADPGLTFTPLSIEGGDGDLLLPLCVSAQRAQLGCFGYGTICGTAALPGFAELGAAVHAATGVRALSTLLPPATLLPGLDAAVAHWPAEAGPTTYLLDLAGGAHRVWTAARGSVRTAIRRAGATGLRPARVEDTAGVLAGLHRRTMARHDLPSPYRDSDLAFLADEAVTVVVADADGPQAATVMAVGGSTGYHIMQLTTDRGRAVNAGVLALWTAIGRLAERGVTRVDLGSAADAGQERFKARWGAVPATARLIRWAAPS